MKRRYKKFLIFIIFLSFCIIGFIFFILTPEQGFHGYVIQDTNLSIYFPDFPYFWSSVKKQPITISASKYLFEYLYNMELFFRKKWGIRPTPFRWYLWVGKPLLISWNKQGDYLVSIKPGRLFRLFLLSLWNMSNNIIDNREYYCIWKGNELLISNKDTILNQVVPCSRKPLSINNYMAYIELGEKVKVSLSVHSENNLFVEGHINNRRTEDYINPFSDFSNSNISSILLCSPLKDILLENSLKNTLLSFIPPKALNPVLIFLSSFKDTFPEKLYLQFRDKGLLNKGVFLYSGMSDKFLNPIPIFGFWVPYKSNDIKRLLSELDLDLPFYPHQWNSFEGYVVPAWNNAFCFSLVYYKEGWIICTQEPFLAEIITQLHENRKDLETSHIISINIPQISEDIEKIFLWCAKQELLNGINERDMSAIFSPWKQFLKEIGTLKLTIRPVENKQETYFMIRGGFVNEK
ncbi:MAG: hypothetical protein ACP5UA_04885 [Candidatus Hydrogenedens sp.]